MKLESGNRVQDYRLIDRLGAGAFGEVWKVAHLHLPRIAAIKFATSEGGAAALERQGVAQFGLDHPGISKVLDANLGHSPPYVIFEYVEGKSLRQHLRERGRFEIQDVAAILRQLVEAIAFAHARGVVHGDLKPENILVVERGVEKTVKVTDFQLGSFQAGDRPEAAGADGVRPSLLTGGPRGTYHYLAPEQELGERVDGRADLFALGVVLFEMATGTLPQGRDLPSDVNPAISWWWDHVFSRCYTGRDRRYRDAEEMLKDIHAAGSGPAWGEMPSQRVTASAGTGVGAGTKSCGMSNEELVEIAEHGGCAPVRRGPILPALAVGCLALMIPMGVIHSIAGLERLGGPYTVQHARLVEVGPGDAAAESLGSEFAMARQMREDALRSTDRYAAAQKMDQVRKQAYQQGYVIDESGKVFVIRRRR